MSENLSVTQRVSKPAVVVEDRRGVVAAQHRRAALVGAEVLAAGGDAVDAAVAVSFAIGVVEPWMSGPAGGGAAMVFRAREGRSYALDYGMRAPAALDPADYPLSGTGRAGDLFPWEAVADERNVQGATAVAVPGVVGGTGLMHARFGRMAWCDLLAPAVDLAREGPRLDWYASLLIASVARSLAADADAAALFLDDGVWPRIGGWTSLDERRLDFSTMADTLATLAEDGAESFHGGDVGRALAADVEAKGGSLRIEDLATCRAEWRTPLSFAHRDARLDATPRLTAGPTFRDALARLAARPAPDGPPGPADHVAVADALSAAYARRLSVMGDAGEAAATGEHPEAPSSTTHFSVVDREGNMVAMTQTLLSVFGARCVSPSTGLLLNNGIMWFDPVPGRPNSLAPAKRCLMNVCPVIGHRADGARFALGASGGRKIVSAVAQLSALIVEHGMDLDAAFHAPRIDVSGGDTVIADDALPRETIAALADRGPVAAARRTVFPFAFACPAGVMAHDGRHAGATEPLSPYGDAVAEPSR